LLTNASLYPESRVLSFAETLLNDADEDVQKAALDYLAHARNRVLVPLLDETSLRHASLGRSARIAALRLKIVVDPVAAFTEVSSSQSAVSTEMLRLLEERVGRISSAMLVQGMESADRGIRGLAARALWNRGELTTDRATLLLTEESFRVRQIALEALMQQGMQLSPDIITQYLKETPPPRYRKNSSTYHPHNAHDPTCRDHPDELIKRCVVHRCSPRTSVVWSPQTTHRVACSPRLR
jgi:hypothetical protein